MIGQVIEIDYQLYVKFGNGTIAILPTFYWDNCVGVWRDFTTTSYITNYDTFEEDWKVSSSSTPPFTGKRRLEEYLSFQSSNYIGRKKFVAKHGFNRDAIFEWKKENGYPYDKTCNELMRDRLMKIRKLKKLIKNNAFIF